MKCKELYYQDINLIEFKANIIEVLEQNNEYHIALDQTAFYPEGGGMSFDKGTINNDEVLRVYKKNNQIYHVLKNKPQNEIIGKIDYKNRIKMIQFHDAQHILSAILEKDYDLITTSHHVHKYDCDLFLSGADLTKEMMMEVEQKANKLIFEHRKLDTMLVDKNELYKYNIEDNPIYSNPVRITNIETLDDYNACGCMHFENLSKVQMIKCFKVEKVNKEFKILFSAGLPLFEYFDYIYNSYRTTQQMLKANDENYTERFESIYNKNILLNKQLDEYKYKYYQKIIDSTNNDFIVLKVENSDDLKIVSSLIINHNKHLKGFIYSHNNNKYQFNIVKQESDDYSITKLFERLKEKHKINGGGKGLIISGQTEEDLAQIIYDYI